MSNESVNNELRAGYFDEDQMAKTRGRSKRTLRAERQRGDGPPYTRDGRDVLYPIGGYRAWLEANTRRPVRHRSTS
ncbi:helix-turn-helix transcriptional regulator [Roseiarcus sp.]|uniref:helix-turn-helix transcriptional regulator n=1 Tax=Roseiarcus sp. TaxID=1969460 RepID=UPI003F953DB5